MSGKIIQIKQRNGTTYLYEDHSFCDKERGYSTYERKCIGKLGSDGQPVYNEYYPTRDRVRELVNDSGL